MLENVNGVTGASLNTNSAYASKSGTTVKTVSDVNPVVNTVSVKPVLDSSNGDEQRGTNGESGANPDVDQIKDAVDKINQDSRFRRTGCKFQYHEISNRVSITLYDQETKEVIREIPPEDTIKMLDKLSELTGLIVDEKM